MTTVIDTPDGIAFAQFCARKHALALEIKGIRFKTRRTVYSICKSEYGFKGSRESVLEQMDVIIEATLSGAAAKVPPAPSC